jgi:hypothetical protein
MNIKYLIEVKKKKEVRDLTGIVHVNWGLSCILS